MANPEPLRTASLDVRVPVWPRWALFGGLVLAVSLAYAAVPAFRGSVDRIVAPIAMGKVREIKLFILSFGWWGPVVSALLMILQTLIAPLPAFVISIANAMAFGMVYGFLLTCASAVMAAFTAYYLARWLGRPFVERWVGTRKLDDFIERYGGWGVLVLRLFPVVSFDYVSYAVGLTAMRPGKFGVATFVGMLPATVAFTLLGNSIDSASRWSLIGGGFLLGALLLAAYFARKSERWRAPRPGPRAARPVPVDVSSRPSP